MNLRCGVAAMVVLFAGCAASPVSKEPSGRDLVIKDWPAQRTQLERLTQFSLQGRASTGGALSSKVNLIWRQRRKDFDLTLSGPFGIGGLSLAGDERLVEVRSKNGAFTTNDPEATLRENLGWSLPIARLRYWILGLPSPHSDGDVKLDDAGHIATLTQDQWRLQYVEYTPVTSAGATVDLPRRILLSRDDVSIRMVVDSWSDLALH